MSYEATNEVYTLDRINWCGGVGNVCDQEKSIGFMYKVCAHAQTSTEQVLCFLAHNHLFIWWIHLHICINALMHMAYEKLVVNMVVYDMSLMWLYLSAIPLKFMTLGTVFAIVCMDM